MEQKELKVEEQDKAQKDKYNRPPVIETSMRLSKDSQWFIHKTTITTLKHVNYVNKVLEPNN